MKCLVGFWVWLYLLLAFADRSSLRAAEPEPAAKLESKNNAAYEAALKEFRANRIREASKAVKAILIRDPKHKEAAMLLATMYYQNRKLQRALYWFDRGDASLLNNENAFAWGATYLENDEDQKAALGFRYSLKNKGYFRPYCLYYLGVIYYRSGQWLRARKFLQKVKPEDLPLGLKVNRRRYLADIKRQQEKMLEVIIGMNGKHNHDLNATVPNEAKERSSANKELGPDDDLEAPRPDARQVARADEKKGWNFVARPSFSLRQRSKFFDNHGLNHDAANIIVHREAMGGAVNYGDERSGGSGFLGGFEFNLGNLSYTARVEQTEFFAIDENSGVFSAQKNAFASGEKTGFLILQPRMNWFLNDQVRFEIGAGIRNYFPSYDSLQNWGQNSALLGVHFEDDATEIDFEFEASQLFDQKVKKEAQDLAARAEAERQMGDLRASIMAYGWKTAEGYYPSFNQVRFILADSQVRYRVGFLNEVGAAGNLLFSLFSDSALQLRVETFSHSVPAGSVVTRARSTESIESAAYSGNKALVSFNIPLWDSASVTGSSAYQLLSGYHFNDVDTDGKLLQSYVTDVRQMSFQGGGMISFADWIRLSGTYTVSTYTFVSEAEQFKEFRRRNSDYTVDSEVYLEVSKSF